MTSIGTVLGRHRNNATLSILVMLFGLALLACGVLLFVVRDKVAPEAAQTLQWIMLGLALVGVLTILLGWAIRRGGWEQGELGVRRFPERSDGTYLYRDIVETCQFYRAGLSVNLGWRREGQEQWQAANGNIGGYHKFLDRFMHGYLQARVPVLMAQLDAGQSVSFRMVTTAGAIAREFAVNMKGFTRGPLDTVQLSRERIAFAGNEIRIDDIAGMDVSAWTSRLQFQLRGGSKVSVSYTALFDGPLLLAVLEQLLLPSQHTPTAV
ncbi:hypothetical protein [Xanthomonas sp. WHRI 7945]|nr:hypothetical protein [Xanthomonas campestris pv. campestris]